MRKIYSIIIMLAAVLLHSCKDEVDLSSLSFPPSILTMTPGENSNVPKGNFNLKVVLVDGTGSPLSAASLKLTNEAGTEIFATQKTLTGTKDSLYVEGATFSAVNLPAGNYKLWLEATDSKGLTTTKEVPFKIVNSLYVSVETKMFIAGEFNGWGADALQLVADNTWELKNIDLKGGKWKFKNTPDWTDNDWGDADCDGVMKVTTGGGPDTNCSYTGLSHVRFNDKTLAYTVTPAVIYKNTIKALYLLGTPNSFQGSDYKFTNTADHTWQLNEIRLKPGDAFKFAEGPHFEPKNFGASDIDGKALLFGPNIVMPNDKPDAFYKIVFNDETLLYTLEIIRYPFPANLYIVGGSTVADWTPNNSVQFVKTADGKFEIYSYLTTAGDGFKLLQVKDWAGDWGKSKTLAGKVAQNDEDNLTVPTDGFYRVGVDFLDQTYTIQAMNWGLIGNATGSWDVDKDLTGPTAKGQYTWTITTNLTPGAIKFRANDGWDFNLGDTGGDGSLNYGGSDITIATAGNYTITLNLNPAGASYTYTVTKN